MRNNSQHLAPQSCGFLFVKMMMGGFE